MPTFLRSSGHTRPVHAPPFPAWHVLILGLLAGVAVPCRAQTIPNPSFEADTFATYPGYCNESGNGPITGWNASDTSKIGLNSVSDNPFANDGIIPDGANVAFIQSFGETNTLATTITGLAPGTRYAVSCRVSSRASTYDDDGDLTALFATPTMLLQFNGGPPVPFVVPAVEPAGNNATPYDPVVGIFTATSSQAALAVGSSSATDGALLLDDFTIAALPPTALWTASAWTNDASAGIGPNTIMAACFGATANLTINGVTFLAYANGNPSLPGTYTVSNDANVYTGQANNFTDPGSAALAANFIYGGNPATISLLGLTTGQTYRLSLFGVGFDDPGNRNALFSGGGDELNVDEDLYGKGNGIRADYTFVANATNNVVTVAPVNPGNTFHLHGIALTLATPPSLRGFALSTTGVGFNLSGADGQTVLVEVCTNLTAPVWMPLQTNVLSGSAIHFSEPLQPNQPGRFYRLVSP